MGIGDFFKSKRKKEGLSFGKRELDIPPAPPVKGELPIFPSPGDIPMEEEDFKKRISSRVKREEDLAVKAQEKELKQLEEPAVKKPLFVYLDAYKDMLNEVNLISSSMKESTDSLIRVVEFREDEEKEYNRWDSQIKDIQRKLTYVDKVLFKNLK